MAGAISLEDEGEGEDVDDPKYAKFSRGLKTRSVLWDMLTVRDAGDADAPECLRVRCPPKSTQKPTQGPTPALSQGSTQAPSAGSSAGPNPGGTNPTPVGTDPTPC